MGDEKTRENMIRAAKDLRAFYRALAEHDEADGRAMTADLSEMPTDDAPPAEPGNHKSGD